MSCCHDLALVSMYEPLGGHALSHEQVGSVPAQRKNQVAPMSIRFSYLPCCVSLMAQPCIVAIECD